MKKFLPRIFIKSRGFTLIELLVVMSIIGILAVVSLVLFNGSQKNARDSRRRAEINSIASSLETNKNISSGSYTALANSMFSAGVVPTDPGNNNGSPYCVITSATSTPSLPTGANGWGTGNVGGACSTISPGTWNTIANNVPPAGTVYWTICAYLENNVNPKWYCRSNQTI